MPNSAKNAATSSRINEIPPLVKEALISAEDDGFYQHAGIEPKGFIRAALNNLATGRKSQGASTITMQVARNFFLSSERSYIRKLYEVAMAFKIEANLSKDEILQIYMTRSSSATALTVLLRLARTYGVQSVSMEELLKESDYVVAAVPLTDQTFHLFNEERIAQMKAGSVLINIARGPVVDEEALAQALASGHLGGCAVDVFPKEPCTNSVLTRYANALLTPHSATSTAENSKATNFAAANNLVNYLKKDIDAKYVVVQGTRY